MCIVQPASLGVRAGPSVVVLPEARGWSGQWGVGLVRQGHSRPQIWLSGVAAVFWSTCRALGTGDDAPRSLQGGGERQTSQCRSWRLGNSLEESVGREHPAASPSAAGSGGDRAQE